MLKVMIPLVAILFLGLAAPAMADETVFYSGPWYSPTDLVFQIFNYSEVPHPWIFGTGDHWMRAQTYLDTSAGGFWLPVTAGGYGGWGGLPHGTIIYGGFMEVWGVEWRGGFLWGENHSFNAGGWVNGDAVGWEDTSAHMNVYTTYFQMLGTTSYGTGWDFYLGGLEPYIAPPAPPIKPVPEPGTLALLCTGLIGLVGFHRRRKA